ALSIHLEAKTAYLALVLKDGGAEVAATGSNPLSTRDDIAAALVAAGVRVFAWYDPTPEEYHEHLALTLGIRPHILIDDGGDLVGLLHGELAEISKGVIGGCEETTTGVMRLQAHDLEGRLLFPMMAVNNARTKYLFDNRYGTGESVWAGIMRTTNLLVAGKTVVVFGYGWCGKGISLRAKGLGAKVVVCEVDPVRALEAVMEGFAVMPVAEAAAHGDFFVTVTGNRHSIPRAALERMKGGAVLANAGHFDVEIDKQALAELAVAVRQVRPNITEYQLADGRRLYLLAEGRLVNLAAGDGHPVEVMDMSFALQALGLRWLVEHALAPGVYPLPPELDDQVARMRLAAWGVSLDHLTEEQRRYLASWQ
ncbi:MAG: adenosylhomocysteinase, partial [Alicyclobacillus sp.]|nr:adenosylhomocysteinase [Alicyclobacillus sp.]